MAIGSFCPWCKRPVKAERDAETGLLHHGVGNEEHWWGVGVSQIGDGEPREKTTGEIVGYCRICDKMVTVDARGSTGSFLHKAGSAYHYVHQARVRKLLEPTVTQGDEWRKGVEWDASKAPPDIKED